jgi:small subunit ribosomal protein S1
MSQVNAEHFDWTQLLNEYDYARPQRGEVREGVIMKLESDSILVSIGSKREGTDPHPRFALDGRRFCGWSQGW